MRGREREPPGVRAVMDDGRGRAARPARPLSVRKRRRCGPDIEAFFSCLGGDCCATCFVLEADFDGDGDSGTDADIKSFLRVIAGGPC